jgi:hypothetical protein
MFPGARATGYRRAPNGPAGQFHVDFDGWIPARINDLAGEDTGNGGKGHKRVDEKLRSGWLMILGR